MNKNKFMLLSLNFGVEVFYHFLYLNFENNKGIKRQKLEPLKILVNK